MLWRSDIFRVKDQCRMHVKDQSREQILDVSYHVVKCCRRAVIDVLAVMQQKSPDPDVHGQTNSRGDASGFHARAMTDAVRYQLYQ